MKKIFLSIIAISAILLAGCFGSSSNPPPSVATNVIAGFHIYETPDFKLQIPDGWEVLTPLNFMGGTPPNTVVAFRSNIRNPRFTPNIAIVKNDLPADMSTDDYAKTLRQKISNELISYKETAAQQINVNISDKPAESLFMHVEGKEAAEADLKRFMEIPAVKGKAAYIAIGSFLANVADTDANATKMETIIKSFEVK